MKTTDGPFSPPVSYQTPDSEIAKLDCLLG